MWILFLDLNSKGSYVVIVWGFMTFKWALFLLISARKFHKLYSEMEGNEAVITNDENVETIGDLY